MTEWITMDDRTDYRVNALGDVTVSTIFDCEGSDPEEERLICQGLAERFGGGWTREGEWSQAGASGEVTARFLACVGHYQNQGVK